MDRAKIFLTLFQYETIFTTNGQKIGITFIWILSFAISISTYIYHDVTAFESKSYSIRNETNAQHNSSTSISQKKNE